MKDSQQDIIKVCDKVKNLLLEKNLRYGDSALNPIRIMSQASTVEQILVRIDDKLNRLKQGNNLLFEDEDVIMDLIGYYVLLKVALDRNKVPEYNEVQFEPPFKEQFEPTQFEPTFKDILDVPDL